MLEESGFVPSPDFLDRAGFLGWKEMVGVWPFKMWDTQTMANGGKKLSVDHENLRYCSSPRKQKHATSNRGGLDHEVRFPL